MSSDDAFMRRAIEISAQALDQPGPEPFGAVVVRDGKIGGEGINRSLANFDPTSHGETKAIRDAARNRLPVAPSICAAANFIPVASPARCASRPWPSRRSRACISPPTWRRRVPRWGVPDSARCPIDVDHLPHDCAHPVGARRTPPEQARADEAADILTRWAIQAKTHHP